MSYFKVKYFWVILIFIISNSCNAPHNNPLDPENPDRKTSTLEGVVKTTNVPQTPIVGAKVFWSAAGVITSTDKNGFYKFDNLERRNGYLIVDKDNYATDSTFISFNDQKKITQNIFLNANPKIIDLKFYSITTNKFPNSQKYSLEAKLSITDDENDIDSVFIENIELNSTKQLLYNPSTKYYENVISLEDLNITSIDIVIGKTFLINVLDANSKKFIIGESNIKRIIKEEIEITSPSGRDTLFTNNPLFQWRRFIPGFEYR